VVSSPTERRARYLGIEDVTPNPVGRAWACFPLHQTGLVSGAIGFSFPEATTFPETDLAFLAGIAEHVSTALERAALLEDSERARREAERSARRLRRLELVTDAALSDLPFDELLVELLDRVRTALEGDTSTLLLVDDAGNLRVRASRGIPRDDAAVVVVPPGAGVAGRILASGRPQVIEDVPSVPPRSHWLRERVASLAGVPLRVRGDIVGVLHVGTTDPRLFTDEDVQLLELVGARVASALERASFYGDR
jgi:GAF domain-containing protein